MASARESRLSEHLIYAMQHALQSAVDTSPHGRLVTCGNQLEQWSSLPLDEFLWMTRDLVLANRSAQFIWLEGLLSSDRSYHEGWRHELKRYRDASLASMGLADFFVPAEYETVDRPLEPAKRFQAAFGRFGTLLKSWNDLWQAARRLRECV